MNQRAEFISAVSPDYLGAEMVTELVNRLTLALSVSAVNHEIILVDDGSPDDSWDAIEAEAEKDQRVKGLRLSRNFGQHYAITAGLKCARGDWIVVLDCDLQDRPEEIPSLLAEAVGREYDLVLARRRTRNDSWFRRLSSACFYKVFSFLTDTVQDSAVANFGIYRRKVIDAVLSMGDSIRYFPTMSQWVGFRRGYLDVQHDARAAGHSTYSLAKLLHLALHNVIAFSNKPLKLTVKLGIIISTGSFLIALFFLIQYLRGAIIVLGYTSLILSIWFLGGIIISLIGMVGIYVGYTFEKVKGRPAFIVQQQLNIEGSQ